MKWERSSAGTKLDAAIWKKHTEPQMVTTVCRGNRVRFYSVTGTTATT